MMQPSIPLFQPPSGAQAYACDAPSPFPPSFDGQPAAYAFGLFGDVLAAALALAVLLDFILEAKRKREVKIEMARRTADKGVRESYVVSDEPVVKHRTALFAYRAVMIGLLLFVVMRALPDAAWMLLWGEVTEGHIRQILWVDLMSDGFALIPLFVGVVYWAWSKQAIPQKLMEGPNMTELPELSTHTIYRSARIVFIILLIAIGVTLGKATGG